MKKIKYHPLKTTFRAIFRIASRINQPCVFAEADTGHLLAFCSENNLSINACLIKIISNVYKEYPLMNGILTRSIFRKSIVIPENTDIALIGEKTVNGTTLPCISIINECNKKPVNQIETDIDKFSKLSPEQIPNMQPFLSLSKLPGFIQYGYLLIKLRSAMFFKKLFGTVGIIDMSDFDITRFHPFFMETSVFGFGAVQDGVVAADNGFRPTSVMCIALAFNHCVLDGADAARIIVSVKKKIEDKDYIRNLYTGC